MTNLELRIQKAIEEFSKLDYENIPVGKYTLPCGYIYMIQEYETKSMENAVFESHLKMVDIQWMIEGTEKIFVKDISMLKVNHAYDDAGDYALYDNVEESSVMVLTKGAYAVFYPQDGHMPGKAVSQPMKIRKAVIKVPVKDV